MQNQLELCGVPGGIMIKHLQTSRDFFAKLSEIKFTTHGFKNLDAPNILNEKISSYQFAYSISPVLLTLKIPLSVGKYQMTYELECKEVFGNFNQINPNATTQELNEIIGKLKAQVNNLTAQLQLEKNKYEELVDKVKYHNDLDYEHCKHYSIPI